MEKYCYTLCHVYHGVIYGVLGSWKGRAACCEYQPVTELIQSLWSAVSVRPRMNQIPPVVAVNVADLPNMHLHFLCGNQCAKPLHSVWSIRWRFVGHRLKGSKYSCQYSWSYYIYIYIYIYILYIYIYILLSLSVSLSLTHTHTQINKYK